MSKIPIHRPKNLTDYVGLVERLQDSSQSVLWYRGCGNSNYELLPSLYRHPSKKNINELVKLENELMTRFRQRSIPMQPRPFTDDWDILFFMQHYNIPTRLLDWSENPLIGLYFSVMSAEFSLTNKGKKNFTTSSSVWILNQILWNRHALIHQSYDGNVLVHGDHELIAYTPCVDTVGMSESPVALFGAYNSPRIVAQRGVFTIFGHDISPMEQMYEKKTFPVDCLQKVVLSKQCLPRLQKAILDHGLTESYIFPDLDGLAQETKRFFGF